MFTSRLLEGAKTGLKSAVFVYRKVSRSTLPENPVKRCLIKICQEYSSLSSANPTAAVGKDTDKLEDSQASKWRGNQKRCTFLTLKRKMKYVDR